MKKYLELDMIIEDDQLREILIAQLNDLGFYGFLEENNHLKAYHDISDSTDYIPLLRNENVIFTSNIIEEENWNAQWESSFEPVIVEDFASIRADFHQQSVKVKHDIIITPKMSFGTGHHATTYAMIKQMKVTKFEHKKVMDFGTGTGILAILAEKCGASEIDAIDIDDWSITNAIENLERNNCKKINVWKDEKLPANKSYDIILANINLHVLLENREQLYLSLNPEGTLIISGIMKNDEKIINDAFLEFFSKPYTTLNVNEWLMFNYSK